MITLYGGPTPKGRKVAIMLEELGLPFDYRWVDIMAGDQLKPEFLALNPNNKMPVIVDPFLKIKRPSYWHKTSG